MKSEKHKFVKKFVFGAIIFTFFFSILSGLIAVLTLNNTIRNINFFSLSVVPFFSAIHIITAYLWNDRDMILRNKLFVFPILFVCLFFTFVVILIFN